MAVNGPPSQREAHYIVVRKAIRKRERRSNDVFDAAESLNCYFCIKIGLTVWTGRALQAENGELAVFGLAHLYPALDGAFIPLAIMDIRAHPISFSERP